MTMTQITTYLYTALAADSKTTSGIAAGSEIIETDTGARYLFDGTDWVDISPKVRPEGGYSAAVSVTRPADTTAYTAGDVVGAALAALTFPNMGPTGGGRVILTTVQLEIDVAAVPSGMSDFTLHLYSVTPPSALADNAPFDLPSGDRASYLGRVVIGTPEDLGATIYVERSSVNKQVKLAGTSLFGYLVTNGAYTPSSAAVKKITLHAVSV